MHQAHGRSAQPIFHVNFSQIISTISRKNQTWYHDLFFSAKSPITSITTVYKTYNYVNRSNKLSGDYEEPLIACRWSKPAVEMAMGTI